MIRKYGESSDDVNAHIQNTMSLSRINSVNPHKIHEFTEKLLGRVQAPETMRKLKEINGYVRLTLDKLQEIREDLVRIDNVWQE